MISQIRASARIVTVLVLAAAVILAFASAVFYSQANTNPTVTISNGDMMYYGTGEPSHVTLRWVTHINGGAIDTGLIPGSRSNVYCVQPFAEGPTAGTYNFLIIDDDGSGKMLRMRKLIYYLPGAYGYNRVTASRWFGINNATGVTDFCLGHLALSYMYADYNDSATFGSGTKAEVIPKVKEIVLDIDNLADPPASFKVFWVMNSGKQDMFGALYEDEFGTVTVSKSSSIPAITDGNANYSLTGAQYVLYMDAACSIEALTSSGERAVLTIGADGKSNTVEVETGNYFMKEVTAPKGYALDTDVHSIEVKCDSNTSYSATDKPKSNPAGLLIQKADKETGKAKPQGGASLAGAEYTVSFYAVVPPAGKSGDELAPSVAGKSPAKIGGKDAVWVFRTDASGQVLMNDPDKYLVKEKSASLYRDSSGRPVFPIGIISVRETKAPEGYLIDSKTYYSAITESGEAETLSTLKTFTGSSSLKEQVIRGDVKFVKSAEGRSRLGGVPFRFTSLTTGESHTLVTDRNGYASTSADWNLHSSSTNAGKTAKDGVWYNGYNSESEGAKVNDSLGALPYDTYRMEELRCEANKGYELISDVITIERNRTLVDLGTFDDEKTPVPKIDTKARDDESGSSKAAADSKVTIVDEVSYSGVPAGRTYTLEGVLMDKATGKPVIDGRGSEVKGKSEFYAESTEGKVEVKFEMDASTLGGRDAVVFEYLKHDGELITSHEDINCKSQTVKLEEPPKPEIDTDLRDGESGGKKADADEMVWVIDTVDYRNLTPGETYLLCGVLMDKATGQPLLDDAGNEIRAGTEFTPKAASGSVELSFRFSGKTLAGKDAVAFEFLYLKKDGKLVTSHEDINDRKQTVGLTEPKVPPTPPPDKPKKPASPKTGDEPVLLLWCLAAMAAAGELLVLTLRRRNGRLN